MSKSPAVRALAAVCIALGLVLAGFAVWRLVGDRPPAAVGAGLVGGAFELTDQNGVPRRDGDFRGRFMLVFFGYTYCPDVCPIALATMSAALDALGDEAAEIAPLFITVDPARDTVERLHEYATNFHPRLVALTGGGEAIRRVAAAYRVYYQPRQEGEAALVDHSSAVYLMGPDGRYLTHFGAEVGPEEMARTIAGYL